jgi:ActR/RegA family two-component response regulator
MTGMGYALLIDDDEALLQSVRRAASSTGMELLTAKSWDEGLALFHVHSPNLVIADYNLPGSRHGLRLLAELRTIRPSARLVLVSGYIDTEDAAAIERLDLVDRALPKIDAIQTVKALMEEIQKASGGADSPTDWQEYAKAYVRARRVSLEDLETIDRTIQSKRGIT